MQSGPQRAKWEVYFNFAFNHAWKKPTSSPSNSTTGFLTLILGPSVAMVRDWMRYRARVAAGRAIRAEDEARARAVEGEAEEEEE